VRVRGVRRSSSGFAADAVAGVAAAPDDVDDARDDVPKAGLDFGGAGSDGAGWGFGAVNGVRRSSSDDDGCDVVGLAGELGD
jgi:hypothetical protein